MNLLSVLLLFFTVSSAFAQKCDCGSGPVVYYPDPQVDYPDPEVYYPDPEVLIDIDGNSEDESGALFTVALLVVDNQQHMFRKKIQFTE
ncbi:uncharacterized protein LOC119550949 isoform X2 [Drosophila subpulchrella]|uniref:uncharacterized protein LOC119550949 isoform X2 n=1 Tax=Drosophila subpulchrella TaxID=1486046 RepID=UPI0018A192CD|nr:uncharacterized protein LOC119550949 isoform X2 [Drosophila subpulchrella]